MVSNRGQAVLISLRRHSPTCRGQDAPVERLEAEIATKVARRIGQCARSALCRLNGALAQLGEHLLCKQRVIGSIPIGSTKSCGPHLRGLRKRPGR